MGEERNVYTVLVGKPEGKSLLGRPRRRWEDEIRMDLTETDWRGGCVCGWSGFRWLKVGAGGGLL
jgi:hypothetical protein